MELEEYDVVLAYSVEQGELVRLNGTVQEVTNIHEEDDFVTLFGENGDSETYLWDTYVSLFIYA